MPGGRAPTTYEAEKGDTVEIRRQGWIRVHLRARKWPVLASVVMFGVGMAFMFFWLPDVEHLHGWYIGDDGWGVFRGAHYVGWGFLGGVYYPENQIIAFPGMEVLLAPLAMLSGALHLSESLYPFALLQPSAALLLQPAELLLTATVVFASDALAERLAVPRGRRIVLCLLVATVAWPLAAIWDHAEDALAMSFAIYALVATLDRKWSRCGWLLGFGVAMQPLVLLLLPLLIGASPRGKRLMLGIRSLLISAALVTMAFVGNAAYAYRALVQQPEVPLGNHATPWLGLDPKLVSFSGTTVKSIRTVTVHGIPTFTEASSYVHSSVLVVGGPSRTLYMVVAVLIGLYVWRRPQDPVRLLWLATVVLALRCAFESVMTPYYLAPPLFLALVLASRQGARRFWAAAIVAIESTVFAYHHMSRVGVVASGGRRDGDRGRPQLSDPCPANRSTRRRRPYAHNNLR